MDRGEQNSFLSEHYAEAMRYMDNAKDTLKKAVKEDYGYYKDKKYVKSACGIAYLGVLVALDAWLILKGVNMPGKKKHKSIEFYMSNLARLDKKLMTVMDTLYSILHIDGYYGGITNIKAIALGFELAYEIIEKIKPEDFVPVRETRAQGMKRTLNNLMISFAVMFR